MSQAKLQDMEKKLQGQDSSSKNASMGRKQLGRDINGNLQHNLLQRGSGYAASQRQSQPQHDIITN